MALPTNVYTRYLVGTNAREDLIEKITNSSPEKTPVISSFGRATAENTYHEWQRDTLRAANKDNAALDGDDAVGSAKAAPGRVANYCQIFQDTIITSGRAEVVKKAGLKSAMAYHKAKAYKEIQRDMEAALLSANAAVAGSAGVAPKAGGLGVLIYTNALHGAGGSTVAHTTGAPLTAPTAGTARAFTEALLKTAAQNTYNAVAEVPEMIVMSASHKQTFSGFAGIAVNRFNVDKGKQGNIIGGADIYLSDFGKMEIVPHYLMSGFGTVYGLNVEYGDAVYLRGFQSKPLGVTGDSMKEQVLVDTTFRLTSEVANFKIADLTP
jgi:Family of unknown function (DUF5309)